MKEIWYEYVIANKSLWPYGMTLIRLNKVKSAVFADEDIMWDLLVRHGADKKTPEEMMASEKDTYEHCIGNFVCNIIYKMKLEKILK